MAHLLDNSTLTQTLEQALQTTYSLLTAIALDENFTRSIMIAFGNLFDAEKVEELRKQWISSNFEALPAIKISLAEEINGANGAFSSDTKK